MIELWKKPSPLQERVEGDNLSFLNWAAGEAGPIDVTRAPGMGPYLSFYDRARAGQEKERMGTGALQMGLNASNPDIAARIAEANKLRREQEAAGGLERALVARAAEARGTAMPLLQMEASRESGLAGLASQNYGGSRDALVQWHSRPKKPSFLQQMGMGAAGAVMNAPKVAAMI